MLRRWASRSHQARDTHKTGAPHFQQPHQSGKRAPAWRTKTAGLGCQGPVTPALYAGLHLATQFEPVTATSDNRANLEIAT